MREYIRHPSDIPIQYYIQAPESEESRNISNISRGGLCFQSAVALRDNTLIRIHVPIIHSDVYLRGIVKWCRPRQGAFDVGMKFIDEESEFRIRLIEQICYIEHYRRDVFSHEGRQLSSEEAAMEWIEKFAADFPSSKRSESYSKKTSLKKEAVMENKKIVNQMIDMHRKAFENCFSTILTLQEQAENLMKIFIDHVPGISDEGIRVMNQCADSYNKGLEELKKAIDEGYTRFETFFDSNTMVTFQDGTEQMFNALLNQKSWMPEDVRKIVEKLFANYMNGSDEFKKYFDENVWCLKHFPPVTGKPKPQDTPKAEVKAATRGKAKAKPATGAKAKMKPKGGKK